MSKNDHNRNIGVTLHKAFHIKKEFTSQINITLHKVAEFVFESTLDRLCSCTVHVDYIKFSIVQLTHTIIIKLLNC